LESGSAKNPVNRDERRTRTVVQRTGGGAGPKRGRDVSKKNVDGEQLSNPGEAHHSQIIQRTKPSGDSKKSQRMGKKVGR